ncbi:Cytochrome c-555 precursor [Roseovarius albus]|uniref:Cytochrome c-555 n=2 Tax=Roseovarius albus TaxID=1247867 RepID=A0A1X6YUG9_9RHOB|nr:Cytochrome c-555 precursor [Roseovarius albus]
MNSIVRKFTSNPFQISMICLALGASFALAHSEIENPTVLKRVHAMEDMEEARLTLSEMAQGLRGFDALSAERARARLIQQSADLPKLFKSPQMDPKTTALQVIWGNWRDFKVKSNKMKKASKGLNVSSVASLRTGLPALENACQACHRAYRQAGQ